MRLSDRLSDARRAAVLGREAERASFLALLDERVDAPRVLWIHGVGGIGKSTLLDLCAEEASASGWSVTRLDARALRDAPQSLDQVLPALPPRSVVMIDTCEDLGALEQDLFERHLPALADDTRLLLAGRHPPRGRWALDPGWRAVLRVLELTALDADSARTVLDRAGMSAAQIARWLPLAQGHPLALALAAEAGTQGQEPEPESVGRDAEFVTRLLERFVDTLPDAAHREALELCALARYTTESLLRSVLGETAPELFAWLRQLSFVRAQREGLVPHDLVRELVVEDLRWRDADAFRARRGQLVRHYATRMREARDVGVFLDFLFVRRFATFNAGYLDLSLESGLYADSLRADDAAAICAQLESIEGADSAARAQHWMQRQPEAFSVYRGTDGVAGWACLLTLGGADWTQDAIDEDLVLAAARRWVVERSPAGTRAERAQVLRWFIQPGALHQPGPVQNLVQASCLREWTRQDERGVRWMIIPHARAEAYRRHFAPLLFEHAPEYAVELNGLRFEPWIRDWQRLPFWTWMGGAFELEMQAELQPEGAVSLTGPAAPLSPVERAEALRRALRDFDSDARLSRSPLRAYLGCADLEALRGELRARVAALEAEPRGAPLRRILEVTFLSGCPSQELAAERLALPFGTYRHRLRAAEALLVERLQLG